MRLRRPSRKAVSATVAAVAVTVAVVATVSAKGGSTRVAPRATAVAVEVAQPGRPTARFAAAAAGRPAAGARAIAVPADGSLVRIAAARVGATIGPDTVAGVVVATRVQLLDGEVAADAVTVSATTTGPATTALTITGLTVLGVRVAARPGGRIAVGDWAVLEVGAQRGTTLDALRLRLVAAHRGVPAGTLVIVGRASAAGAPPPLPRGPAAHAAARTVEVAASRARLSPGGRAFPLDRRTPLTDTFGAQRAGVGWHHGIDLFGPRGTPVLAVSDGTVFEVGWNVRGGHRLWLRDAAGNTYYYAHLDAYTAAAHAGARVRAGQQLGTLGSSGDAERTPPHLHFEVHPAALAPLGYDGAVDPTAYLAAWAGGRDLLVAALPALPAGRIVATRPAAFLLEADDR